MAKDPKSQEATATSADVRPEGAEGADGSNVGAAKSAGPRREQKPERRTPDQWAEATGNLLPRRFVAVMGGQAPDLRSARHRAAAIAHGWDRRARDGFPPLVMSRGDYVKALEAAERTDAQGRGLVHDAALCLRERTRRAERAEKARAAGKAG